ncbi:hypothetical protein ACIQOU_20135 [Streptomyces sp. NPDC091279]|uniref:hypothetical protein n=1 Tax=unclassified Streptomyces TaxID=2593676 RepID=UPI00382A8DBE
MSALSLVLITGCGGESSDNGSNDAKEKGTSSSESAAKTYSAAELKKLIVAKADLPGYEIQPAAATERFAASKDAVTAKDATCAPLAYAVSGFAPGDESAYTDLITTKTPKDATSGGGLDSTVTMVSLSSYEGEGAQETLKSAKDAVAACAGGFTVSAKGQETQKYTKVAEEQSSGTGDESVAFAVTNEGAGKMVAHAEIARHGNTLATYYSLNLTAAMTGKKLDYTVPAEIPKAQSRKLK